MRGDVWIAPDLLRDGATTAYLMRGDTAAARNAFRVLSLQTRRSPSDARTLLLEALLR